MKTHKEQVEELNKYLSNLSEHHDMYVTTLSPCPASSHIADACFYIHLRTLEDCRTLILTGSYLGRELDLVKTSSNITLRLVCAEYAELTGWEILMRTT